MDPNIQIVQGIRLEHRHGDGSWSPMEPLHHGQPEHDAERGWLRGLIFRCTTCDEEVAVTEEVSADDIPEARR
jgi:hypothetical protein